MPFINAQGDFGGSKISLPSWYAPYSSHETLQGAPPFGQQQPPVEFRSTGGLYPSSTSTFSSPTQGWERSDSGVRITSPYEPVLATDPEENPFYLSPAREASRIAHDQFMQEYELFLLGPGGGTITPEAKSVTAAAYKIWDAYSAVSDNDWDGIRFGADLDDQLLWKHSDAISSFREALDEWHQQHRTHSAPIRQQARSDYPAATAGLDLAEKSARPSLFLPTDLSFAPGARSDVEMGVEGCPNCTRFTSVHQGKTSSYEPLRDVYATHCNAVKELNEKRSELKGTEGEVRNIQLRMISECERYVSEVHSRIPKWERLAQEEATLLSSNHELSREDEDNWDV